MILKSFSKCLKFYFLSHLFLALVSSGTVRQLWDILSGCNVQIALLFLIHIKKSSGQAFSAQFAEMPSPLFSYLWLRTTKDWLLAPPGASLFVQNVSWGKCRALKLGFYNCMEERHRGHEEPKTRLKQYHLESRGNIHVAGLVLVWSQYDKACLSLLSLMFAFNPINLFCRLQVLQPSCLHYGSKFLTHPSWWWQRDKPFAVLFIHKNVWEIQFLSLMRS